MIVNDTRHTATPEAAAVATARTISFKVPTFAGLRKDAADAAVAAKELATLAVTHPLTTAKVGAKATGKAIVDNAMPLSLGLSAGIVTALTLKKWLG